MRSPCFRFINKKALKLQQEQNKQERRITRKQNMLEESKRRFELKQQRKKRKTPGQIAHGKMPDAAAERSASGIFLWFSLDF